MAVGFNTFATKALDSKFVVKNNSSRTIKIFGSKIGSQGTRDLMSIPFVSEADIKHSLLKGELYTRILQGIISISDTNINLVQYSQEFTEFLEAAGADLGLSDLGGSGVLNLVKLANLDIGLFSEGSTVSVSSVGDTYMLKKTSTDTADGISIILPNAGIGRWFRLYDENARWLEQDTWFVNPITGNDENDGFTSITALKTLAEFDRRIGTGLMPKLVTLTIEESLNEEAVAFLVPAYTFRGDYRFGLDVIGTPTAIGTGTITNLQVYDETTLLDGYIEDTSIPVSWTSSGYFKKMIRLTSGTNSGSFAWIIKDKGNKIARHSPFYSPNVFTVINPDIGDDYEILDLVKFQGGPTKASPANGSAIQFINIHFPPSGGANLYESYLEATNGSVWTSGCLLESPHCAQDYGTGLGIHKGSLFDQNGATYQVRTGQVDFYACCFGSTIRSTGTRSNIFISEACVIQSGLANGGIGPIGVSLTQGGNFVVENAGWLAAFDQNTSQSFDPVVAVQSDSNLDIRGKIWGTNWGGRGLWIDPGGQVTWKAGDNLIDHLDVQGTAGGEIVIGGLTTTYLNVGTAGIITDNNAAIVPSSAGASLALPARSSTRTVTTTDIILASDKVILADATGGTFTLTLPLAANAVSQVTIKKIDSSINYVNINGSGAETIDGALAVPVNLQYESLTLVSDGTEWWIV